MDARILLINIYLQIFIFVCTSKDPKKDTTGSQYIVAIFAALSVFSFVFLEIQIGGTAKILVYSTGIVITIFSLIFSLLYELTATESSENYLTIKMPIMVLNFVLIFSLLMWSQSLLGIVEIFFKTYLSIY